MSGNAPGIRTGPTAAADGGEIERRPIDDDGDGAADRAVGYAYVPEGEPGAGRPARILFYDDGPDDRTADRIQHIAYDAGTGMWASFAEDADGDGNLERRSTYIFEDGAEVVRLWESDSDGDGRLDTLRTFDIAENRVTSRRRNLDTDGDGGWDRVEVRALDAQGRVVRAEYHDWDGADEDLGAPERVERIAWDPASGRWASFDVDEDGDGDLERRSVFVFEGTEEIGRLWARDSDGDGKLDSFHTFDAAEGRIVSWRRNLDTDGDGGWDEVEIRILDDRGRASRVEVHDWDGDGEHLGPPERIREYTWHDSGKWATAALDYDGDGAVDKHSTFHFPPAADRATPASAKRWRFDTDDDGAFDISRLVDPANGDRVMQESFDPDGDGAFARQERYAYNEMGWKILTEFDAGHDGGYEAAAEYEYDAEGNRKRALLYSDWSDAPGAVNIPSGTDDGDIRYMRDGEGRITLAEFDDDGDGFHTRAVAYEYGDGHLAVKTTWYDDWAIENRPGGAGLPLVLQTIDRTMTVADGNADGAGESRRHDTYDDTGAFVVRTLFDFGSIGDWDRAAGFEHDDDGRRIFEKTGASVAGADPLTAAVAWDQAEIYILSDDGGTWEIHFFDGYDGSSDFAGLSAAAADRVHRFGLDLDGDGGDDARYDKLDGDGRIVESLFDLNASPGAPDVDRAEAYAYDADDRITEVRFHDAWGGTFDLSRASAEKIHSWTYDDVDGRWLSFSEDLDGDGNPDIKTTVTRHGAGGALATRETRYDDGSGGGTSDDGVVDKRKHESFDSGGELVFTKYDSEGDGDWARHTRDGKGRIALAEFDGIGDGAYTLAIAYEYGAGGLVAKTTWYDDWAVGADGGALPLTQQTIDRALIVQDIDLDGAAEFRRHDTYDDSGLRRVRSLFDTGIVGDWDRAEGAEYDGDGNRILEKTGASVAGADPLTAAAAWDKARIHILDGAGGTAETRFFDGYDGSSDFAGLSAAAADRIHHFGTDHDGDGTADIRRDMLDGAGRPTLSVFDDGSAEEKDWAIVREYGAGDLVASITWYDDWGGAEDPQRKIISRMLSVTDSDNDGTAEARRHDIYDETGRFSVRSLFDSGIIGDWDRAVGVERDGDGNRILEKTSASIAGADPDTAAVAWDKAEIHILDDDGGTGEIRFFDSYDGSSDFAALAAGAGGAAGRIHYYGRELDDDGSDDARIDKLDDGGRVAVSLFDIDSDGVDRAEAYAYDFGGRKTETRFYDPWTGAFDLSEAGADKILGWTYDTADDADGRWLSFSEDLDGDGNADLETAVAYHGDTDILATRETRRDDGSNGGVPDDGAVDRVRHETFDSDGALVAAKRHNGDGEWMRHERDSENRTTLIELDWNRDGTFDQAIVYEYNARDLLVKTTWYDDWAVNAGGGGLPLTQQTIDRALIVQDSDLDGSAEFRRHDTYDDSGRRRVESLFDSGVIGDWNRAEAYVHDYGGRKTEVRFYDDWTGTFDRSSESADKIHSWTYDAVDAADGRWLSFSEDFDGDGNADIKTTVAHHGDTAAVAARETAYDDGSGGGVPDDGAVDKIRRETFDSGGALVSSSHYDAGKWTRRAHDGEGRVTLAEFDDNDDGAYTRAVAYEYNAKDLLVKTSWYDDWAVGDGGGGLPLAQQTVDRVLSVQDGDLDGAAESRRHDTYDDSGLLRVRSLFDSGTIGDWDRAEGTEYDDDRRRILEKTGSSVAGADPLTAAVVWDKAWIHILGDDGSAEETRFFDSYDGSSDFAGLSDGAPSRIHRRGQELDGDGSDDARHDRLDGGGRIVESLFDIDSDGVDRAEAYAYDAAGRKTETRFYDSHAGSFDLAGETADRIRAWTYAAGGNDPDWRTFRENGDADEDDHFERRITRTYDEGGALVGRLIELDDDGADDGVFDRTLKVLLEDELVKTVRHDHDNDGIADRIDDYVYTGADTRPSSIARTDTFDNADPNDDAATDIGIVYGSDGNDSQTGQAGAQWISLGPGDDVMAGGTGADRFVFRFGDGVDVVADYLPGPQDDRLWIRESIGPGDIRIADEGTLDADDPVPAEHRGDTALSVYYGNGGDRIILIGWDLAALSGTGNLPGIIFSDDIAAF